MPVRVLIAVLMLAGFTVARVCPCACGHAHPVEPTPADDGSQPVAPDHDPHCPCATGLAVEPAVVPQIETPTDNTPVVFALPPPAGGEEVRPRQPPDVRPPVGPLPLYLTLLTLRN
jgi:hypothetical protein